MNEIEQVFEIAKEVILRGIHLTDTYGDYFKLKSSLSTLGETGRGICRSLCEYCEGYNPRTFDRDFSEAMRKGYLYLIRANRAGKPREDLVGNAKEVKRKIEGCEMYRKEMVIDLFSLLTLYAATRNECVFLETEAELRGEPQPEEKQKAEENGRKYSKELLKLFNWHEELLESLVGLSNGEIAGRIKQLAKERDKFGKPLIESPGNYGNKSAYAKALKENELIKCGAETFRRLL